jgi:hypothetical protein
LTPAAPPLDEKLHEQAEAQLFGSLLGSDWTPLDAPAVFILGAPRSGSTAFYQGVVRFLELPYFTNFANELFPRHPVLTAPIHRQLQASIDIEFTSAYGKTTGAFQPSEASAVMRNWFGGDHPSQANSANILPGKADHLLRTAAAYHRLFGAPIATKNAWNCFRIACLAQLLPRAFFVWIRRDLVPSALSDLAARYVVQGDPQVWNSATPASVAELRKLPHWAQVVENQYEFARAIESGLQQHAAGRHAEIWYEDYVRDATATLSGLAHAMRDLISARDRQPLVLAKVARSPRPYPQDDEVNLRRYVAEHEERFQSLRFDGKHGTEGRAK